MHHTGRAALWPTLEESSINFDTMNSNYTECKCKLRSANETGDFSTYRDVESQERAKHACSKHQNSVVGWDTIIKRF